MPLDYLKRGVAAGLLAGLAFGLLTALVANPLVGFADELGHGDHAEVGAHAEAGGHAEESHGVVSMAVTQAVSVLSGVLWGVLLGAVVFGVVFYLLEPAIPGTGATKRILLAGAGFLTVSGAPWLALPPAPPGVEQSLATGTRLQVYAGMMIAGALACLLAGLAYNRVRRTRGPPVAVVAAAILLALLVVPAALAPANHIEHALDSGLAAGLTGLIVFGQVMLWAVMAGAHTWLSRAAADGDRPTSDRSAVEGAVPAD